MSTTPQLSFPLVTSASATNPFCYTVEAQFAVKKIASPVYNAIAVTGDVTPTVDGVPIPVPIAGRHDKYAIAIGGHNYGFSLNLHPLNTTFLKYGTELPNYATPAGTAAESLQFLMQYQQALGTNFYNTVFLFWLGCRPVSANVSISAQGLVEVTMEWSAREMTVPIQTANGGMTSPVIPTFASISGPVFQDSDAPNKPFVYNGVAYAVNQFEINWNWNTAAEPFNGSDLADAVTLGGLDVTGSFTTPVGQDLLLEAIMALEGQQGVDASYTVKVGSFVINMDGVVLTADDRPFPGAPGESMKHTYSFTATRASIGTTIT
jgi:Phage tail tube protein